MVYKETSRAVTAVTQRNPVSETKMTTKQTNKQETFPIGLFSDLVTPFSQLCVSAFTAIHYKKKILWSELIAAVFYASLIS